MATARVCPGCGESFCPRRESGRFCSARCRMRVWRARQPHPATPGRSPKEESPRPTPAAPDSSARLSRVTVLGVSGVYRCHRPMLWLALPAVDRALWCPVCAKTVVWAR